MLAGPCVHRPFSPSEKLASSSNKTANGNKQLLSTLVSTGVKGCAEEKLTGKLSEKKINKIREEEGTHLIVWDVFVSV